MKTYLIIIFTILTNYIGAQNMIPKNYKGENINRMDSLGRNDGKWIEFIANDTTKAIKYVGVYESGKKIGIWNYYYYHGDMHGVHDVFYGDDYIRIGNKNNPKTYLELNGDSSIFFYCRSTRINYNPIKCFGYKTDSGYCFYNWDIKNKQYKLELIDNFDLVLEKIY